MAKRFYAAHGGQSPSSSRLTTLLLIAWPLVSLGAALSAPQVEAAPGSNTNAARPSSLILESEIPLEELEAYLEVESLLGEEAAAAAADKASFLEKSTARMQAAYEDRLSTQFRAESSNQGAIRGYSSRLVGQLLHSYQLATLGRLDELSQASERAGTRLVLAEKQLQTQLVHLNEYLASLACESPDGDERRDGPIDRLLALIGL